MKAHSILDYTGDKGVLTTTFDEVAGVEEGFFLQFDAITTKKECDSIRPKEGDLVYRASASRNVIVFDINQNGELIVIGANAGNYWINSKGELMFNLLGKFERESDALFHDGYMGADDKMYAKESKLLNPK